MATWSAPGEYKPVFGSAVKLNVGADALPNAPVIGETKLSINCALVCDILKQLFQYFYFMSQLPRSLSNELA
jgi:hypothetical protein